MAEGPGRPRGMDDRRAWMFPASRTGRIARVAAYGGGGLLGAGAVGALGVGAVAGLLLGESKLARRRIPQAVTDPPSSHDTTWAAPGVSPGRPPIRVVVLG